MEKTFTTLVSTKDLSHEQWLDYRRMGIGGSDAAAILGLNPWSSQITVFADKLGASTPPAENEAMRLGTDLENYVAKRFEEAAGKKVRRHNAILQSVAYPFMLANVDRMVIGENAGLECKTTSPFNKSDWEGGHPPDTYYCQCMHYMAVTGFEKWYLAVLVLGSGFYWYEVNRNEDDIAALIEVEQEFWKMVETKTPPDPDGSTAAASILKSLYTGDDGGEVALTGLSNELERYMEIEGLEKALSTEKKVIAQRIQMQMGNAHIGHANGYKVSWKPVSSTRLDTKRIRSEHPEWYDAYSNTSVSRRFTIKQEAI